MERDTIPACKEKTICLEKQHGVVERTSDQCSKLGLAIPLVKYLISLHLSFLICEVILLFCVRI